MGLCQQRLANLESELSENVGRLFVDPLRKFVDSDIKSIVRERKVLESKRLDLDAAKNKWRKIKATGSAHHQQMVKFHFIYCFSHLSI